MLTDYHGWTIDPTPDSFFGKYFARARIVQMFADEREEPPMHIERDIEWFDRKEDAIDCAVRWATAWIDARPEESAHKAPASAERPIRQREVSMADGLTSGQA